MPASELHHLPADLGPDPCLAGCVPFVSEADLPSALLGSTSLLPAEFGLNHKVFKKH